MDDGEAAFDDGLQPERTALSWRRTGLALLAASSGAARILPEILPVWTVVPAGLGIAISFGVLVAAHRRYRLVHAALTSSESAEIPLHGASQPPGRKPLPVRSAWNQLAQAGEHPWQG